MESPASPSEIKQSKLNLYKRASLLAQITIFYNLFEGFVSIFFGMADEALSLFGFGIDSIGAILIAIFSFREGRESFEKARGEFCHGDHP